MAFGLSPKNIQNIKIIGLSEKEALVIALEAAKKLGWNIGYISKKGFIAYTKFSMTSWSEEVQIKIDEGNINLKSECTGSQFFDWGKNKQNNEAFISQYNSVKRKFNLDEAETRYVEIERDFVSEEEDILNRPPLSQKEKISGFFSIFKPTEGYFITPILLNLNLVVFIIMAVSGVSIMLPDNESLLLWGANFRPETLDGEWWRLITSCFLHIGVLHLLMNMYALIYIGLLLEPYLGKFRFLSAYLITGIAGSAASLYWNELTISAGASGAIFGMYGVFLGMLSTNLIEKSARKALFTSIAIFVGYNLLNGLKGGIDNAAHIGGLVSGIIVGLALYPSLIKPKIEKLKYGTIGVLTFLIISSTYIIISTTSPGDFSKYESEMNRFVLLEEKALSIFSLPESSPDQVFLSEIEETGIPNWQLSLQLLEGVGQLELPTEIQQRNSQLIKYCNLRIKTYELIHRSITERTDKYQPEIESHVQEIDSIIFGLKNL